MAAAGLAAAGLAAAGLAAAGLAAAGLAAGKVRGQRAGTVRRPPEARATTSGPAMSSIGTGRNTPASNSGIPGSSQAMTRIAGRTAILANVLPRPARLAGSAGPGGNPRPGSGTQLSPSP